MRILVAPLNWGLGHATRCIPIIHYLVSKKHQVIIATDGQALKLLKAEFPHLPFVNLPSFQINYTVRPFLLGMFLQLPKILLAIIKERRVINSICKKYEINAIISDNRYGIYSTDIPSVFICHQINIQFPSALSYFGKWINKLHHQYLNNFHQVWIPDIANGITEKLSLNQLHQSKYIGMLSRFNEAIMNVKEHNRNKQILFLLSGPEPARSQLEDIILQELIKEKVKSFRFVLVRGTTNTLNENFKNCNSVIHDFANSTQLEQLINEADLVVVRSGYTSVMDMMALGKKVVFVPTPGQTEQKYLGKQLKEKHNASVIEQKFFCLDNLLANADLIPTIKAEPSNFNQFQYYADDWLKQVQAKLTNLRNHD
ncbi:MAG: hypothetical protein MUF68_03675 [Cyclobacteriaceae bacterium]|nr:hypothetical protein [Cyclobacteriaceae bacterium]